MRTWDELHDFLLGEAANDLEAYEQVRPCLVAFRGDEPLFLAWFRPCDEGRYEQALIELLAVSCPLGADRLALSVSARTWSDKDQVSAVTPGVADPRQRVVLIESVDASTDPPERGSLIVPFSLRGGRVRWEEDRLSLEGADGWMSQALFLAATDPEAVSGDDEEIRKQVLRCVARGHLLAFDPKLVERLDLGVAAAR
jgi:hypothetical protein